MKGWDLASRSRDVVCSGVGTGEPAEGLVLSKEAFRVLPGTPTPVHAEVIKETS